MGIRSWTLRGWRLAAPKSYAEELGWKKQRQGQSTTYSGHYRVSGLRYQGWIAQTDQDKLLFYIHDPPLALLRDTAFGGCFHFNNDGWWLIGFKPDHTPPDVASGIAAIQKALGQAFETRSAKRLGRA